MGLERDKRKSRSVLFLADDNGQVYAPDEEPAEWAGAVGGLELSLPKETLEGSEEKARHAAQRQLTVPAIQTRGDQMKHRQRKNTVLFTRQIEFFFFFLYR